MFIIYLTSHVIACSSWSSEDEVTVIHAFTVGVSVLGSGLMVLSTGGVEYRNSPKASCAVLLLEPLTGKQFLLSWGGLFERVMTRAGGEGAEAVVPRGVCGTTQK